MAAIWIDELRREIAIPFRADEVPMVRAVLLHQREYATLILTAHHSVADGLSLVFANTRSNLVGKLLFGI
jgi:hypothetical protein